MLSDVLVINKEKKATSTQIEAYIGSENLRELSLSEAVMDSTALLSLCRLIKESTTLKSFNFTGTLLTLEGRNQLLQALTQNKSLERISLINCLLSDKNEPFLSALLRQHPKLKIVDISAHRLTSSVHSLNDTICASDTLENVNGFVLSGDAQEKLVLNKRIAALKIKLTSWQTEAKTATKSLAVLESRKKLFNHQVADIKQKHNNPKGRLNPIISEYYWYIAKEFQCLGMIDEAQKYFNNYIEFHANDNSSKFQAFWEMMNMYFVSAGELTANLGNVPPDNEIKTKQNHFYILAESYFNEAQEVAQTQTEKDMVAIQMRTIIPTIAEHFIEAGEAALNKSDNNAPTFKRIYTRK